MKPRLFVTLALCALAAFVCLSRFALVTSSTAMFDSIAYLWKINGIGLAENPRWHFRPNLDLGHPLYVWWCGAIVRLLNHVGIFGFVDVLTGTKVAGILATASSVFPMYWLARWLVGSRRGALLATAFYCVIPLTWWWSSEIMSDAVGVASVLWAFGFLALWLQGGSVWWTVLACIALGTTPLVRVANLSMIPVFVALFGFGLVRRRQWLALLTLPLVLVPIAACIAVDQQYPGAHESLAGYFERTEQIQFAPVGDYFADHARWKKLGSFAVRSLGLPALAAALAGLLTALFVRWPMVVFAIVWCLPFAVSLPLVRATDPQIRYYLTLMPIMAIAMVFAVRPLRRWPMLRGLAVGAIAAFLVAHGIADQKVLHYRQHALDVAAKYYAQRPPNAFVVTHHEFEHLPWYKHDRERVMFNPNAYHIPYRPELDGTQLVQRVDRAIDGGRPVYTSSLMDAWMMVPIRRFYRLEPVHTIPGHQVRNVLDQGMGEMGSLMRREIPLTFYRLHKRDDVRPRALATPKIVKRELRPGGFIELAVSSRRGANRVCVGFVTGRPAEIDWTKSVKRRTPLGDASVKNAAASATTLDATGTGTVRIPIPADAGPIPPVLYVAIAVLGDDGEFLRASPILKVTAARAATP